MEQICVAVNSVSRPTKSGTFDASSCGCWASKKKNPEVLRSGFAPWGYKKNNKANLLFLDALDEERHVVLNHFQRVHTRHEFSNGKIDLIIAFYGFHQDGFQTTTCNIE